MHEFTNTLQNWEQELINKYPLIYKEPNPQLLEFYSKEEYDIITSKPTYSNLRYGFEFGSGWSSLVDEFSRVAQSLVTNLRNSVQPDAKIHACIFKEKFGFLTWQGDDNLIYPYNELFRAFVRSIEDRSARICELTGKSGSLCVTGSGWRKILCREKARELGYKAADAYVEEYWQTLDKKENDQSNTNN